jgi:hypothetical protein
MSNDLFKALSVLAVAAEVAALIWALARSDLIPVIVVNLVGAAAILVLNIDHLGIALTTADAGLLLLFAFALLTLATNLGWFIYPRYLLSLVWIEFSVYALISLALLIFVFTFKMRLF